MPLLSATRAIAAGLFALALLAGACDSDPLVEVQVSQSGAFALPDAIGCDHTRFAVNSEVVRSCVLKVSCTPFDPLDVISTCVTLDTQQTFKTSDCRGATTCDDIARCTGEAWSAKPCAPEDGAWKCDGTRVINCVEGYEVDCQTYGGTCALYDDPVIGKRARCQVLSGCKEAAGRFHCASPHVLYECHAGKGFGRDCSIGGGTCEEEAGSNAGCRDPLPSCGADALSCVGAVSAQCVDGKLYESNCGGVGLGCDPESAFCLAPGCAARDWDNCSESCSGSKLSFCYGGAPYSVDCKDFGFTSCETFRRIDGTLYAACVN